MGNPHGLAILEIVCSSFFTLEFLLRVIFCPTKLEFFEKPMNWIDLISILPFYVSYFYDDYKVKMFLVIRVLRLFRYVTKQGKNGDVHTGCMGVVPSLWHGTVGRSHSVP